MNYRKRNLLIARAVHAALYMPLAATVTAAELPVPCVSGACVGSNGAPIAGWLTSGSGAATVTGNVMNIRQTSDRAVFNWQTFNLSPDAIVRFTQPGADSVALNRIFQGQSTISGTLTANGRVYLLNQNGIVFGQGAKVDVAGLIASSLDISSTALNNGIATAVADGQAAFTPFTDAAGNALESSALRIQPGAEISSGAGGQVLMFAPEIVNQGRISTPGGQTILAAGQQVYLATSADPNLRGLLVEVGTGGTVTNGDTARQVGEIVAERGNITLAGLAVNQLGRLSATTTVREGGSIRLQARDGGFADGVTDQLRAGAHYGDLTLGRGSSTEILLTGDEKAVDATAQQLSRIELLGRNVQLLKDAQVRAKGGIVAIDAVANALVPEPFSATTGSRIRIADGAVIDVSGSSVVLPVERNVLTAELRGNELANSPVQRNGPLRGETVFIDIRDNGVRADGTTWQGTPLADVSGQISLIERGVNERNLNGGSVRLSATFGDVVAENGSRIDLSGGQVRYTDGFIRTSDLLGADGSVYDISQADPDRQYVGLISEGITLFDRRWGVNERYAGFGASGRFEAGYVEGRDAGSLQVAARQAVLDGAIIAATVAGTHQRNPATTSGGIRPFDQLPLGGRLAIGVQPGAGDIDRIAGDVRFGGSQVLPTLQDFDPLHDALPADLPLTLRTDLFGSQRITRIDVNSNGRVELPAGTSLDLPGQGELHVAARQVEIAGNITAPSGDIRLAVVDTPSSLTDPVGIDIRSGAVLDVSGGWVNDSPLLNAPGAPLAPLLIDGGTISLQAGNSSLHLESGSVLDVSGGGRVRPDGRIVAGDAGTIALSTGRNLLGRPAVDLQLGAELRAWGIDSGGTLDLVAPEICIASIACEAGAFGTLWIDPERLVASGFADISLSSSERGLTVKSGTVFNLRQQNLLLDDAALAAPTGTAVATLGTVTTLPDYLRQPMQLSLTASIANRESGGYTAAEFAALPGLTIESGASLIGSPGAHIALESNTSLIIGGMVSAPGGTIDLSIANGLNTLEEFSSQGIWLDAGASLLAQGAVVLAPDPLGLRIGEVLDGGQVRINARRGSIIANAGSVVDVSGTSAALDLRAPGSTAVDTRPVNVVSDGGRIELAADYSMVLSGNMRALPGAGSATAAGGSLSVSLGPTGQVSRVPAADETRTITVSQTGVARSLSPGTAVPAALARQANLSADALLQGGFSEVALQARTASVLDPASIGQPQIDPGRIEFAGDVHLSLPGRLLLDAATIAAADGSGDVNLDAPYLRIGHGDATLQQTVAPASTGTGALTLRGDFMDVVGNSVIDGFGSVRLHSDGDLRLNGLQAPAARTVSGSLVTGSDLTLAARQVYASTLSDFSLALQGNADGVLRFESTGSERADVLSAGSRLRVNAPTIEQAGVLRAPFGTIEFDANTLRLEAGSLTSTSAEGSTIPFGSLQAGKDWVYGLQNVTLVVGETLPAPQKSIALTADDVDIAAGAVIDLSGGGDLLAYEFMSGPNGRRDVLSALEQPGRYAIVPGLNIDYAPVDPQESRGSTLRPGDSIHLATAVDGLPAGDYVLLPARYALLPGAYVVEAKPGYADMPAGEILRQVDGSAIVAGFRRIEGTGFADARSGGFEIRTAALVSREAQYHTALASKFFAAGGALRLPQDAGVLALSAASRLNIDGTLRADAAAGARGAAVDVSAAHLRISDAAAGAPGEVVVSATDLQNLGAESILLGARRSVTPDGTALQVAADSVIVDSDLTAPEIILAARDEVRVTGGVQLAAAGDVPVADRYLVEGDGALLRVATGDQAVITRTAESGVRGRLVLEEGSRVVAPGGALALDASLDTRSQAQLDLTGGALSLGATRINLGDVPAATEGLSLSAVDLAAAGASELTLVSRSTVDVFGDFSLQVENLTLDTAVLRSAEPGASASIDAAGTLTLVNRSGTAVAPVAGSGELALSAGTIVMGDGEQSLSGFDHVLLTATDGLRVAGDGRLSAATDMTVVAPVLVVATGASGALQAGGELVLQAAAPPTGTSGEAAGLGGKLLLAGTAVTVDTRIDAGAGQINVTASEGDITLAADAQLDVSGRMRDFDGTTIAASAGRIVLEAAQGNVVAQAGSEMNLAAAADGAAGELNIGAHTGTVTLAGSVDGTATSAERSGRVVVDAASLGNLSQLNQALGQDGFLQSREFRQRGAGDLIVDAAAGTLRAREVSLTADGGSISVTGSIDASVAPGGRVRLAARDNVDIGGSVRASRLDVFADDGAIRFGSGAQVDLAGGDLNLRLRREALLTLLDADQGNNGLVLAPASNAIGRTTIEAYRRYAAADILATPNVIAAGNTATGASNPLYADAAEFIATNAGALAAALGRSGDPALRILPGVELMADTDLALGAAGGNTVWDLSQWRFGAGNLPGVLTLRAAGNLAINGSLNDGFGATGLTGTSQTPTQDAFRLLNTSDSWSYRLVAGADLGSANLLATNDTGSGDFSIAPGAAASNATNPARFRLVRTGTGSIEVAAAGDFVLGNAQSVLYTAGVPATGGIGIGIGATGLGGRTYPVNGGDIDIRVDGDIQGAAGNQLVTDWLWRVGRDPLVAPTGFATGWTVNFGRFQQNVAALGGGDVRVVAGGDIRDFSASIPTIGMQTGASTAANSAVNVLGGGDLQVRADGDILGGSYYVGRGTGELQAGGRIGTSPIPERAFYPVLALGDSRWNVSAIGPIGIESVVNPTLLPQGLSQGANSSITSFFSTYGAASAVNLQSASGDVLLSNDLSGLSSVFTSIGWVLGSIEGNELLAVYAPSLRAATLGGDVILRGRTTLYPASGATLELYAEGDIRRGGASGGDRLIQSDADPSQLPTIAAPDGTAQETLQMAVTPDLHAAIPVHRGDASITRVVARTGDIAFPQSGGTDIGTLISLATPLHMYAGGDIVDLPVTIQHDDASDLSSITAGGDIRFTVARAENGAIGPNLRGIAVDGPGTLQLAAGGSIDLQNSAGVASRGNLVNPALADGGADISILVGARATAADHAAMIDRYLVESGLYDAQLFLEVGRLTGVEPQDKAAALQAFDALDARQQRGLLERVLLAELRASAEYAASAEPEKNGDYSRGFAALETLFPGANPDPEDADAVNPYRGDLNLYFSRVYTESGGDIRLLAPGGEVNAGLATPPAAFGIQKPAEQLGIVTRNVGDIGILTYDDLQVNESRVFAVNGSDIMVWSTNGDIDAGRGAKTAISAPSPVITFDRDGRANVTYSAALAGSGIQTRIATPEQRRGDVVLAAPRGVVNAGDAGIVAGNLTIAATAVVGGDNISFSGVSVGVPVDTGGLGASLAGVSAAAGSAASAATGAIEAGEKQPEASAADAALSWLDVFVTGFGEENCRADDQECLRRAQQE